MKRLGVAELKDGLSRHLRAVEAGEEIVVTDHERPIARLIPVEGKSRLPLRAPLRAFSEVRSMRFEALDLPLNSTDALRQERDVR